MIIMALAAVESEYIHSNSVWLDTEAAKPAHVVCKHACMLRLEAEAFLQGG